MQIYSVLSFWHICQRGKKDIFRVVLDKNKSSNVLKIPYFQWIALACIVLFCFCLVFFHTNLACAKRVCVCVCIFSLNISRDLTYECWNDSKRDSSLAFINRFETISINTLCSMKQRKIKAFVIFISYYYYYCDGIAPETEFPWYVEHFPFVVFSYYPENSAVNNKDLSFNNFTQSVQSSIETNQLPKSINQSHHRILTKYKRKCWEKIRYLL